ncbi:GNAT family N-acetyltransferase [Nocardia sp. NPDC057440]|uniref:GNAT family N-acetyltransferase n=1 Tax=Nocardia sp. NPDC057440 TaxID=3346134 RepID=UPI00366AE4DE
MIIEPLRVPLIPDVVALMELGAPYITPRTYSDYWLYSEFQDIMTHPEHRRRGVTRALVDDLRKQAWVWSCRRLYLTSGPGNIAAHKTWETLGFANVRGDRFIDGVSVITDYKGPGKTRAVYELVLER